MGIQQTTPSRRIATSDDLEVSAYLEIAKEKVGQGSERPEETPKVSEGVVIIDFGSQYSHLIARRIRELNVYSEVVPHTASWEDVQATNPKGVILSGGPASVYDNGAPLAPSWVYQKGMPILGICYGMQVLAHQLGGKVTPGAKREYGHAVLHQNVTQSALFQGMETSMPVWMSHGDQIQSLPPGFSALAYTDNSPIAVMSGFDNMFGLQFHPEVAHHAPGQGHSGELFVPHLRLPEPVDGGQLCACGHPEGT